MIERPSLPAAPPDEADPQALLDLLTWASPAWPIGAFAYSGGLEWACEAGFLGDAATSERWIDTLLREGPIWNDAVLFVHASRAAARGDRDALEDLAELAHACATSAERRLETTAQGAAFRRIGRATFGPDALALLDGVEDETLTYPLVFACLATHRGIALRPALSAFLHGIVANLVSAAQRIVPLGQTDGQRIQLALRPSIAGAAERAIALPDADPFLQIGSSSLMADLGSMAHETQYTRLFRT